MGFLSRLFSRKQEATPPEPKFDAEMATALTRRVMGSYDAARSGDLDAYWANADSFDADSANSKGVREILVRRSRYEMANNGYADGIGQTYATDLVGIGPMLRMQTSSNGFNQLVEREFYLWQQSVSFHEKLWTMAHAKHVDGEAFGVMRKNPSVNHTVTLDVILYETEQCQSPYTSFNRTGIDGIPVFDPFGNPLQYEFLRGHPGATNNLTVLYDSELVAADRVLHWFKVRRPGQHRGVPECASTLNLGAAFRRLRESNLATAEKVAAWTLFLKTIFQPDELQGAAALSTLDVVAGMMTALPNNMEPVQLRAEHPGPQYDTFHKAMLNEQARPKSMPANKARCDSSDYNYASGRLDHQTYYSALDVDREGCNNRVLNPLFNSWFNLAIGKFGWLGGDASAVGPAARFHIWDWPKHRVADVEAEANANKTRLESGQIGLHQLYTDNGMDLEDEIPKMAATFGVDDAEIRKRLLDVMLPPAKADPVAPAASLAKPPIAALSRLVGKSPNGNGKHHAN